MLKIFIADDSAVIRERLMIMLSEIDGLSVIGEARESHETLECIKVLKPDLVVLDICLSDSSGLDVLKGLKGTEYSENRRCRPKVIVFTNFPSPQFQKACFQLGADFFFDKSNEYRELLEVL